MSVAELCIAISQLPPHLQAEVEHFIDFQILKQSAGKGSFEMKGRPYEFYERPTLHAAEDRKPFGEGQMEDTEEEDS